MTDGPTSARRAQWDTAYDARGAEGVSWFQAEPTVSLELIDELGIPRDGAVLDVGGGASRLAERLVTRGFTDVTVLDVSTAALAESRRRIDEDAPVTWLEADVVRWQPPRGYDLWHDRAAFHFLVEEHDREAYLGVLGAALRPGGGVIIGTFAPVAPERCSGLPVVRYAASDLAVTLGPGFTLLAERREEHVTPRGARQPFTWVAGRLGIG